MVDKDIKIRKSVFDDTQIAGFFTPYRFLSNYWPVQIEFEGITYPSVEQAYKAAKTLDIGIRKKISLLEPNKKDLGDKIESLLARTNIRSDWTDNLRVEIMEKLVAMKFDGRDQNLRRLLIETGSRNLIEDNDWGDTFFGVCGGVGANYLGKILMKVRDGCVRAEHCK